MNLDIGQILTVGGPTSVISVVVYVLINAYLAARKDKREDRTSDISTDAGYIDNTKAVLAMMRGEIERIGALYVEATTRALTAEAAVRTREDTIARQGREIEDLKSELQEAHQVILESRGGQPGGRRRQQD